MKNQLLILLTVDSPHEDQDTQQRLLDALPENVGNGITVVSASVVGGLVDREGVSAKAYPDDLQTSIRLLGVKPEDVQPKKKRGKRHV